VSGTYDDASTLPRQQIWDGVLSRSVHGENVTVALIELDADAVVPEHSHGNEQLGVLIQGSLTFTIGGETRALAPGGTWRILADVPHSVAVGPEGAVLVEAFAPGRTDWGAIEQQPPAKPHWP
jgi:quercetin dioxygenase-like cupin family protein